MTHVSYCRRIIFRTNVRKITKSETEVSKQEVMEKAGVEAFSFAMTYLLSV